MSKEFIKEIGIKNEDLKNNTNKEKFLKLSIEEIIYKYFEEDEKIKKIIEEILGKNIPGKEKQIDELKKYLKYLLIKYLMLIWIIMTLLMRKEIMEKKIKFIYHNLKLLMITLMKTMVMIKINKKN